MASSSEDLEEVEAKAISLGLPSSLKTFLLTGVCWRASLLMEQDGRFRLLMSEVYLLLFCWIYFKIGNIGFGVLNTLS
jgi:hypothetical protein